MNRNDRKCFKLFHIEILRGMIKGDKRQSIKYLIQNDIYAIQTRLLIIEDIDSNAIIDEFFIYGREMFLGRLGLSELTRKKPLRIYTETVQTVKKALFYFLCILKDQLYVKDLRILIGKIIWESRFQAGSIWEINV
jgi:hypothetical protein